MEFSIMENLSGPQESIFSLFRAPQLNSHEKKTLKLVELYEFLPIPPISPHWANGCLGSSAGVMAHVMSDKRSMLLYWDNFLPSWLGICSAILGG